MKTIRKKNRLPYPNRFKLEGLGEVQVLGTVRPVATVGPYQGPARSLPAPKPILEDFQGKPGKQAKTEAGEPLFSLFHPYRGNWIFAVTEEGDVKTIRKPELSYRVLGEKVEQEAAIGPELE